jgi:DNA-directed RNA polymerase specialized sigma24 family protein
MSCAWRSCLSDPPLASASHRPAVDRVRSLIHGHATKLMRGIARLSERQRQAFVMRAMEGVPDEDVSAHCALNRNAAAHPVHRARRGLAVQLTLI